ncbi:DNA-3-methyladenine glycosylase [Peptoniphilus raoultii]|uniref:DNA-3-methyladenine glycosylase n=1 Tax=Peptoniphilus raoultii TaxID=1776387 RepID=UPI000A5CE560|nr:DNA-3-methyladenine glycosylase [Peptoniphilus raoultii]
MINMEKNFLNSNFFNRNTLDVARDLLGKNIVRNFSGNFFRGKIVEVEAYTGINDKACHSYGNKKTNRNKIMYEGPGTIYVYLTYGMHYMFNIVTRDVDIPEAVLVRAIEPIDSFDIISQNRYGKNFEDLRNSEKLSLTSGPGKLTKALKIDKSLNGKRIFGPDIFIEDTNFKGEIFASKRIGIDFSEQAKDYPYRFCLQSPYLSKKL